MVCRIKNRHTFKSLPILNSAYFTECRFVIRHITQTDTETETEANFTHSRIGIKTKPKKTNSSDYYYVDMKISTMLNAQLSSSPDKQLVFTIVFANGM